jgi:hypothetical protein
MSTDWSSVKDNLPQQGKVVLIASVIPEDPINDEMYVGWIEKFGIENAPIWQYSWCCGCYARDITHWKELPAFPRK